VRSALKWIPWFALGCKRGVISTPTIISRAQHRISRADISENALKVLYRLKKSGYAAYLVGGGVRDLLLGREPKDFDIATDAHPEQIREIFRNCRLIGRRFRLAHVHFGPEVIEVATFRGVGSDEECNARELANGRLVRDNVYGTIEEDAWRRDFTVNALYYNIEDFSVIDYAGGLDDLHAGVLRLIGDPLRRYREDPVRMLRAVRFAVKLGFRPDPGCEAPLFENGSLLRDVPPARLYEEVLKLLLAGFSLQSFEQLRHYGLFAQLFPHTETVLAREVSGFPLMFVAQALESTDRRVIDGKPVIAAFLFAVLLWEPVRLLAAERQARGVDAFQALQQSSADIIAGQSRHVAIPRRVTLPMREIWQMQLRFARRSGRGALRFFAHPRFRAAYDFLMLRCRTGEADAEIGQWWTEFQDRDTQEQERMVLGGRSRRRPSRDPRRRRGKVAEVG
jgi:poly(A) polymerase